MRLSIIFSFLLFTLKVNAQTTPIGGIINQYSQVVAIDYCTNSIELSDASPFKVDSNVLLIQMKGAQIFSTDDPLYGQVIKYNGAGNYEVQKVKSIVGNTLFFAYNIDRFYDVAGSVQLVTIPTFQIAQTNSPLSCKKWDGTTGGVLILKADSLILNDSVTVSGNGFRGGGLFNETSCFNNGNGGATTYRCATGGNCGANKGEGIANMPFALGRGANANGGGGGNDHNTGGGGGGNFAQGGKGGQRTNVSNTSCPGPTPGEGGRANDYDPAANRIFMGGGGGAGDQNNNEGTAGNDGAGIVIFDVNKIVSNNQRVCANGASVSIVAQSDGAGGAGAGGTVLINASDVVGGLTIQANGGNGGDLTNGGSLTFCFGPGGGAGGGTFLFDNNSILPSINFIANGGVSGKNVFGNAQPVCPMGTVNGAEAGKAGAEVSNYRIHTSSIPFEPINIVSASKDTTVCMGSPLTLNVSATASRLLSYRWDNGATTTANPILANTTRTYTVVVSDSNVCSAAQSIVVTVPQFTAFITATPDSAIILGQSVALTTNTPGFSYLWSPSSTLNDAMIFNPTATPEKTTTYCVTITDNFNCKDSICKEVELLIPQVKLPTAFTPNGDGANDVFRVLTDAKTQVVEMIIYNRWGEIVFTAKDNQGWDGKLNGQAQPNEIYHCKIGYTSILNINKVVYEIHPFTLIR
jgi:gliding motility-associated-like protein